MSDFRKLNNGKALGLKHKYSKKIIVLLDQISKTYVYAKHDARKPNSNAIKYNIVKLGHQLGYKVYANGLTEEQKQEQFNNYKFLNREFLFDIHWYKDKKGEFYMPEKISLVAESELGDRRKGDQSKLKNPAVMFDFQKLLMANAELRLLIFKVKNRSELQALEHYFEKSIGAYKQLEKDAIFLFACFQHDTREFLYCEKNKI
jgi:hypothetical protein